ncbi:hypothetical protein H0X06_03920 [Candidatus Dependentiae bacterium]|nr:hypothetical protein [Candidatus Dependentiae bacterium]
MIKIDYIKMSGAVFLLAFCCTTHASQKLSPDESSVVENCTQGLLHEKGMKTSGTDSTLNAAPYKPLVGMGLIALTAASVYGYKTNEKIRTALDSYAESLKDSIVHHIVLPLSIKAEEIKDEGLKSSDILKVGCGVGICYAFKKAADFFHVKDLFYGDTTQTAQALKICAKEYKKIIIGTGILAASTYFFWKQCCKDKQTLSVLEKLNLTTEQRSKLEDSEELAPFVHETNYVGLLDSDLFTQLLTEDQKKIREEIINEYLSESSLDFLTDIDAMDTCS